MVHQAYELWFRQVLFELETVRACLFEGNTHRARHLLERVRSIERVMLQHIEVIETMSPQDFLEFRHNLAPASGFQSVQFREIEFLSGLKEPGLLRLLAESDEERGRLERRLARRNSMRRRVSRPLGTDSPNRSWRRTFPARR